MSSDQNQEDLSLQDEAKLALNTETKSSEEKVELQIKSNVGGSGDHVSPSKSTSPSLDYVPEDSARITSGTSKEIGDGNHEMILIEQNQTSVSDISELNSSDLKNITGQDEEQSDSPIDDAKVHVPARPTFLESVSAVISDDMDSENQDEDLVLKWDDDDEETSVLSPKADEIEKILDIQPSQTEASETAKVERNTEIAVFKDVDLTSEPKTSEDDVLDEDQEDLLSEIDAQIAELGASLSKAENENIEKSSEHNICPPKDNASEIEIPDSASSDHNMSPLKDDASEIEIPDSASAKNISADVDIKEQNKEIDIIIDKTELKHVDDKKSAVEIEEPMLESKEDLISQANNDVVCTDNLETTVTFAQKNIVSHKVDSLDDQVVERCHNETKDDVSDYVQIESEISIKKETSANLTCEGNLDKNIDKVTNSINIVDKSDNSQLQTSGEDDTFAHDSFGSIEDKPHGVNQPNVMLEIPTQELIDLDDSLFMSQDTDMSINKHAIVDTNVSVDLTDEKDMSTELIKETGLESKLEKNIDTGSGSDIKTCNKNNLENQSNNGPITSEQNKKLVNSNADDKQKEIETFPADDTGKTVIISSLDKDSHTTNSEKTKSSEDGNDVEMKIADESNVVHLQVNTPNALENKDENEKLQDSSCIPQIDMSLSKEDDSSKDVDNVTENTKSVELQESKSDHNVEEDILSKEKNTQKLMDVQPSTSQIELQPAPDTFDDAAEVTDSLGLLAESSRVRDEDDGDQDADDQEISDHDDDDDDFDPDDESSNQQTADHSEDSAQHSESDANKLEDSEKDTDKDTEQAFGMLNVIDKDAVDEDDIDNAIVDEGTVDKMIADEDTIDKVVTEEEAIDEEIAEEDAIDKEAGEFALKDVEDKEFGFEISNVVSEEEKDGDADIDIDDDIVCEEIEVTSDNVADETEDVVDINAPKDKPAENKDKDSSNETPEAVKVRKNSKLRELLESEVKIYPETHSEVKSPSKKKLEISKPKHELNIVDLESSSEDEAVQKSTEQERKSSNVTSVNISKEIEVMSSGDNTSEIISKEGETVINLPRSPVVHKLTSRLNTGELTIKTASSPAEPTLVIPETKMGAQKSKFGALEVFNLDSDDDDVSAAAPVRAPSPVAPAPAPEPERPPNKCVNNACPGDGSGPYYPAGPSTAAYYESRKKKRPMVCQICLNRQLERAEKLVEGIKNFTPLLSLEEIRSGEDLVEISDSESDDEGTSECDAADKIGADKAQMLERQLADMINETWDKFKLDARLREAQDELGLDLDRLEKESAEVNQLLDECQSATDKLRSELYATFDTGRHQLPGIIIYDMPDRYFIRPEQTEVPSQTKRRLSSASESQSKKQALSTAPTVENKPDATAKDEPKTMEFATDNSKADDDRDVSVVHLSAEAAPAGLPPPGELIRLPLQAGLQVFAMRHAFGSWSLARVLEVVPRSSSVTAMNFSLCRVKFENKTSRNAYKQLPARCLAYFGPANARMTIGTRVIALFKDTTADKSGKRECFYSGVVSEVPNPVNKYRYLVFFDDGYAQYVCHADTRLVCEFSSLVWEEVHPFSREFVREYLLAYPERPMVRLHTGQSLKTEWNGKWWLSKVLQVDASLAQVYFEQDKRTEWIYRGSTRLAPLYLELQAAEKHRARPLPRNRQNKMNMPYVEYTRLDEQQEPMKIPEAQVKAQQEEIRRQRAVAKKSTTVSNLPAQLPAGNLDAVTSRVVYYTPKNAVKPYKLTPHTCGPKCRRTDVLALKDLRTYNPLAKPLLSGWERQIVRYKGHKEVMYRAPCGRRLRNMGELHRYLRSVGSDMAVDLFDFGPNTHCLAEFVLNKCIVGKKDLSHGKENVPVPCVNYYDESLPEFCSYNTERTPTAGVPLNVDPEFLCGCDCTDDCQDKSKCACWRMTLEGARTIGLDSRRVGYVYKRLPEPLPSGIYECNARCKCKATCLNRVAQHPLQLKLQVFKTLNRGWGIRALNDVPKGSFLCIYAGNLLTDATANLDGLNEGDEYLAELDYIEVVEQMKEGYEDDIPEQDKEDRKEQGNQQESESEATESEEEATKSKSDEEDGDFEPGFIPGVIAGFSKRLRRRDKKKQKDKEDKEKNKDGAKESTEDDCITISDDEELREPSRFAAQAGMGGEYIPKYRSVRTLYGRDEACYIMDAKVQGNIGRYLNHSCSPNVFVQNVFVDTHDPRFPWVAFFALAHVRAGTELTWNYNYDIGSVPGKALYCYCGAPNCRGRLL